MKSKTFKKILCALLSCLFIVTSFAAISVSAAETTTGTAAALGDNTITLDGVADEDAWKNAPSQSLNYCREGKKSDSVTFKMLWDNSYLYILANIDDSTPHISNEQWYHNDAIEFVIAVAGSTAGTSVTKRIHIQRDGVLNGYFSGDADEKDTLWGDWKVPKYKDNGEDGWVVEFALPLNASEVHSGVYKNDQRSVSVDCVYYSADSTSATRTGLLGWSANGVVDSGSATMGNLEKVILSDEKVITTKLTGASITVGSDLTMNYYVAVTDDTVKADLSKLSMRFTMNGVTNTVTEYSVVNNEYVFAFDGIAPQNMGDGIKAELLYNGMVIDVKDEYSVKDNAAELLTDYASDEKTVRFVTDLLNYGAAAQNYANYKTDALVNTVDGMTDKSTAAPTENDKFVLSGNTTDGAKIASASVLFDSVNKIGFKLNVSDEKAANVKILLDGSEVALNDLEDLGNGNYRLVTGEISTTDFDKAFTLVIMDGDVEVAKLEYRVNSYAYSKNGDAQIGELASALYCLGVSADAYNAQ